MRQFNVSFKPAEIGSRAL